MAGLAYGVPSQQPTPASIEEHPARGLTSEEAQKRLLEFGPNAVTEAAPDRLSTLLAKFWAPVPWMLEAAVLLQVALGEYVEAAIIATLLVFNAALGFFQEGRAQTALAALKSKLALVASARRDGRWTRLPAADLVPGDVVQLSLGAVVPADVRIVSGEVLLDQSMITGESIPVEGGAGHETYAGALVRRGEAVAEVTATGARTVGGHAVELVRLAHAESAEQRAVLGVVRNLAVLNGGIVVLMVAYGHVMAMPLGEVIPLVLTALLASIPVALPATFTLAAALSAQTLSRCGVLPTRLSAVHEAASMDVLCSDKTGTLTQNQLAVTAVRPMAGFTEARVLALAALTGSAGTPDPVDTAVRAAAADRAAAEPAQLIKLVPFDPAAKMSEAIVLTPSGETQRIVKGALAAVGSRAETPPDAISAADELARQGNRVLAVALGTARSLRIAGLLALSDPPRADSAALIARLRSLGITTVMVTGDAPATAQVVARAVGLTGPVCPPGQIGDKAAPGGFAVYASVFPEDKYGLVRAFQRSGHTVGVCGDGANDAPALRQAQIGIAVSTATDAAKSAAGIVLTESGLGGIVAAIDEGRRAFQRIVTYVLNALIKKFELVLFLAAGLVMTGHAVMTPMLMVLLLVSGDFLTMSLTTDRARPSATPNAWRIRDLTWAAAVLGLSQLVFSTAVLAVGVYWIGLTPAAIKTLAFVTLVFGSQATVFVVRERGRLWASLPGAWLVLSGVVNLALATVLAVSGVLMAPLSLALVAATLVAAVLFAFVLDSLKVATLARLSIT